MSSRKRSEIVSRGGRLYHLGIAPHEVATAVFLVGDPARAYKVASRFAAIDHEVKHREYVTLTGRFEGYPMSVIGTGIGTDNVEIALIELHAAHAFDLKSGAARTTSSPRLDLIRIGTSGGVRAEIPAGTLCISEYAIGFDATGPYYDLAPSDATVINLEREATRLIEEGVPAAARFRQRLPIYAAKAHPAVHRSLMRQARRTGATFASGVTASSPGFFGASSRYIEGLVNTVPDIKGALARLDLDGLRVLNMEMESSLLFHLGAALGHRTGTICPTLSQPDAAAELVDAETCIEAAIDVAIAAMTELATSPSAP